MKSTITNSKWNKAKIFKLPYIKDYLDYKGLWLLDMKTFYSEYELVLALLIIFHPTVIHDVQNIINKIKLKEFVPYPKIGNFVNLFKILEKIPAGKFTILESECKQMIKKYKLQINWLFPLMIMVLTGVLPIPYHEESFDFFNKITDIKINDELPCILIKRKPTSANELKNWIDENWEKVIKPVTDKLSTEGNKFSNTNAAKLALGLVFNKIGGKKIGWNKVDDFITKIEEIDENFFGENGECTPDITELTKLAYESRIKLNEFYPIKSK